MEKVEKTKLGFASISFFEIGNIRQNATIAAGENGRVFYLEMPNSFIGFMDKLYCGWYSNTYIELRIDHILEQTLRHTIGEVTNLEEFDPPFLVKNCIEIWAYSNDIEAHTFEAICDGVAYSKPMILKRWLDYGVQERG